MAGAADIQSSGAYDAANSDYTITDSASAILGDTATVIDDGVSTINVDGPVGAGVGVQLGELEDASFETGFSADVNFNIVDDANDITAALSGDTTGAMDNAASRIASGGTATVAEASDIQVAGYDSGASSYTISDSASAILGDTATVIDDGVSTINVDGPVGAGVGVQLGQLDDASFETGFSADVNFNVVDDANAIAQTLVDLGMSSLNNAGDVELMVVLSVDSAADIQGIAAYNASASDYAIEDSSAAILSEQGFSAVVDSGVEQVFATDTVTVADGVSLSEMEVALEAERSTADIDFDVAGSASDIIAHASDLSGASIVTVTDATGAGFVDAADGAALNALEVSLVSDDSQSDVLFNVEDSASAIASELAGDRGALDGAEDLEVDGGNTTMAGAADIQSSGAYDAANSDYTQSQTPASAILGDTATVIDDGVSTINVDGPVGAGVGVQLGELEDASFETGFSADVNFNIVDDANDITAALSGDTTGAMDNAASLIASGGTATVAEASDIQGVAGYDLRASSYTISQTLQVQS